MGGTCYTAFGNELRGAVAAVPDRSDRPPGICWAVWYREEESRLRELLRQRQVQRISHIGSTAVQGIWVKPIVDILLEVEAEEKPEAVAALAEQNGYRRMSRSEHRISLNRGYTEEGLAEKVYHLHLRYAGDNDELYFRDFISENPDAAQEYEALKLRCWKQYEHDRDGYTEAKTEFVRRYTRQAKALYGDRYGL